MAPAALRSRLDGADREARLARAAAAGDVRAFAALYDRHGRRVFNLAFRITGAEALAADATRTAFRDALRALGHLKAGEARVGLCLAIATRDASRALLEQRPLRDEVTEPEAAGEPDPDQSSAGDPGPEAERRRIQQAGLELAKRQREVLALGGFGGLSYPDLAAIVDADRDAVPALIANARLALHDELHGTDLTAAAGPSEECEQALPLIALREDGKLDDDEDSRWLLEHLAHCAGCRLRLDAMQRAAAAYAAWAPLAAPATLLGEAQAAAVPQPVVAAAGSPQDEEGRSSRGVPFALAAGRWRAARRKPVALTAERWRQLPQRTLLLGAGLVILILLGVSSIGAGLALVLGGEDDRGRSALPAAAEAGPPAATTPSPVKRRNRRKPKVTPVVEPGPVQVAPQAVAAPPRTTPEPSEPKRKRRPRRAERPTARTAPKAETAPISKPKPPPPSTTPAPTTPPVQTTPVPAPSPPPAPCVDANGQPVACPG